MAVAPMKDGYTHAVALGPSSPAGDPVALALSLRRWAFPPATIPFAGGDLCLGTWQRILLFGFDRPSEPRWELTLLG